MTNSFYNININRYNPAEHTTPAADFDNATNNNSLPEQANQNISTPIETPQTEAQSHTRLNALDSTILVNESYHNIEDTTFKTEYQINKLEQELKSIDNEIICAKSINDYQKADILTMRKHAIQTKLKELNNDYSQGDMSAKLSGEIVSILGNKPTFLTKTIKKCLNFMSSKILPKVSKKYNSGIEIKTALNKLETLNKNVDELVTMQMPYGEADERYDMLSDYLNRANVIHYNISKTVGTPTFFDTISSIDKEKLGSLRKNLSNFGNMTTKNNNIHKM